MSVNFRQRYYFTKSYQAIHQKSMQVKLKCYICTMIFVTGGTGLVGSHLLVKLSNSDHQIIALKRNTSDLQLVKKIFNLYAGSSAKQWDNIRWVDGDLNDVVFLEEILQGVTEVYHCAGLVSFHPAFRKEIYQVNINGTMHLVNASLQAGVQKFCHVSSVAALGSADHPNLINEQTLWKNTGRNSVYGISKYGAELEVWRAMAEGLNVTIVNPSVILGPGDWKNGSAELFSLVWRGLPFYTLGTKGFVDVRDVADAMILLMKNNHFGQRYVLSSENLSFLQLFSLIAKAIHRDPPRWEAKPWMGALTWRSLQLMGWITGKKPAITRETVRTANSHSSYSAKKIMNDLNFKFMPIEQSIQDIGKIFLKDHIS